MVIVFFFQAEDGIRDRTVTGVQTCALPICSGALAHPTDGGGRRLASLALRIASDIMNREEPRCSSRPTPNRRFALDKIGRASCRERVYISVVQVSIKKTKIE